MYCLKRIGKDSRKEQKMESIEKFISNIDDFTNRLEDVNSDCDDGHTMSISILKSMGYGEDEINEIIEWFKENGGYCDCEVYINVLLKYS